ncbi:LPS translocon maturation chaperone LptM [Polycladidibacter stylochi]|uniref:LPS translocon maturation chaperone LptM n=1 Tax=Polycladidibacter stylochi TaxID=1807766 RepID=UPI00083707CA|nr:lipoprotein [Pseudovibrio stylochi]
MAITRCRSKSLLVSIFCLALTMATAGCGRKGNLVPPAPVQPPKQTNSADSAPATAMPDKPKSKGFILDPLIGK